MKRLFRHLLFCGLLDRHRNDRAERSQIAPLFPIRCDDCGELFYRVHPKLPTPSPRQSAVEELERKSCAASPPDPELN